MKAYNDNLKIDEYYYLTFEIYFNNSATWQQYRKNEQSLQYISSDQLQEIKIVAPVFKPEIIQQKHIAIFTLVISYNRGSRNESSVILEFRG